MKFSILRLLSVTKANRNAKNARIMALRVQDTAPQPTGICDSLIKQLTLFRRPETQLFRINKQATAMLETNTDGDTTFK